MLKRVRLPIKLEMLLNPGSHPKLYLCSQTFDSFLSAPLHLGGSWAAAGPQRVGSTGRRGGLWGLAERKFCAWCPNTCKTRIHTLSNVCNVLKRYTYLYGR